MDGLNSNGFSDARYYELLLANLQQQFRDNEDWLLTFREAGIIDQEEFYRVLGTQGRIVKTLSDELEKPKETD